jgi:uncharacterized protein (DUF4415 family)
MSIAANEVSDMAEKKKSGRKPGKKNITLQLDQELYDFFSQYAKEERDTMAGILRKHVLELKRAEERRKEGGSD